MPMLQAILLSAGDFARGALHAKIFPEPIRMQLLDFYSRGPTSTDRWGTDRWIRQIDRTEIDRTGPTSTGR